MKTNNIFWQYDSNEHCYYCNSAGSWLIFPPVFGGQYKVSGPAELEYSFHYFDTLEQAKKFVDSKVNVNLD